MKFKKIVFKKHDSQDHKFILLIELFLRYYYLKKLLFSALSFFTKD